MAAADQLAALKIEIASLMTFLGLPALSSEYDEDGQAIASNGWQYRASVRGVEQDSNVTQVVADVEVHFYYSLQSVSESVIISSIWALQTAFTAPSYWDARAAVFSVFEDPESSEIDVTGEVYHASVGVAVILEP